MSRLFVDTSFILALANNTDPYHRRATTVATLFTDSAIRKTTTEAVLVEIGNALSRVRNRASGLQAIRVLRDDSSIEIVTVDTALLDRAIDLYAARIDKEWGLTDCISFMVMRDRRIQRVLTTDEHFKQAGFQIAM